METFYPKMIAMIPWVRTRAAYGLALLVVLSFVFINTKPNTPATSQVFIFAVIPLLIAMVLIGNHLRAVYQFILILVITVMSLAFLYTGVALAQSDRTPQYEMRYTENVRPIEDNLNKRYLEDNIEYIRNISNYSQYRSLILRIAAGDNSQEMRTGLEGAINFYQDYISCRAQLSCLGSPQFDSRIRDFWYTFRPVIEERRTGLWDPDFARSLQDYAEAVRPPLYLSEVRRDPATGVTTLIDAEPRRSWKDKLREIFKAS